MEIKGVFSAVHYLLRLAVFEMLHRIFHSLIFVIKYEHVIACSPFQT